MAGEVHAEFYFVSAACVSKSVDITAWTAPTRRKGASQNSDWLFSFVDKNYSIFVERLCYTSGTKPLWTIDNTNTLLSI